MHSGVEWTRVGTGAVSLSPFGTTQTAKDQQDTTNTRDTCCTSTMLRPRREHKGAELQPPSIRIGKKKSITSPIHSIVPSRASSTGDTLPPSTRHTPIYPQHASQAKKKARSHSSRPSRPGFTSPRDGRTHTIPGESPSSSSSSSIHIRMTHHQPRTTTTTA